MEVSSRAAPSQVAAPAGSEVIAACETAWTAIQHHHADVPDVVVVLGTGIERGRLVKLGHWCGSRWIADGEPRGEVLLAGEALHLPADAVFEVLLHEAAHGLNAARGIKDSSRGGRYHNARFKNTAEELGLVVCAMSPHGWAQTSISAEARERYRAKIDRLANAMRIARRISAGVQLGAGTEAGGSEDRDDRAERDPRAGAAVCGCGRRMRMAPSVLARGAVLCGLCGHEFGIGREVSWAQRERSGEAVELLDERGDASLRSDLTKMQRDALAVVAGLAARRDGALLLAEVGGWYASRQSGDDRALLGRTDYELEARNQAARAMLKLDGTLRGPSVTVAGRELMTGELVVIGESAAPVVDVTGRELPPAGVLGTVEFVDTDLDELVIDFAIAGRHVIAMDSPAATALQHGYAERSSSVGAPLIDLRALPSQREHERDEPGIELSW